MRKSSTQLALWLSAYAPAFLWAGLIFYLSAQSILPSFTEVFSDFIFKKSAHVVVYVVLYMLLFRAFGLTHPHSKQENRWIVPVLLTLCYAISDEVHQNFTPGRFGTFRDLGFDMVGVGICFLRQYKYI